MALEELPDEEEFNDDDVAAFNDAEDDTPLESESEDDNPGETGKQDEPEPGEGAEEEVPDKTDAGEGEKAKTDEGDKGKPSKIEPGEEKYGDKMQRRINKEVGRRKQQEERAQAAEARAQELEQELAQIKQERQERERNSELEAKERERADLEEQLAEAHYQGDSAEIAKLQSQMSDVSAELIYLKRQQPVKQKDKETPENQNDTGNNTDVEDLQNNDNQGGEQGGKPDPRDLSQYNPNSADWLRENMWFFEPKYENKARLALSIEQGLILDEGYSYDDPDLYQEVDKRLLAAAPGIASLKNGNTDPSNNDHNDDEPGGEENNDDLNDHGEVEDSTRHNSRQPAGQKQQARRTSHVSGQNSSDAVIPERQTKGLTNEDKASMKKYGFDPNSAKDRQAWLNRDNDL